MKEQDNIEVRSEEVQEILGTPPNWMARYGTLLALLVVVGMGYLAYFIEYPEVVEAGITVSTTDPPKRLVTTTQGRIKTIRVKNEAKVAQGEVLIVFESNARIGDVLTLETAMMALGTPADEKLLNFDLPDSLVLGDLKEPLFDFYRKRENLRSYTDNTYDDYSVTQLRRRLEKIQEGIRADRGKWSNLDREMELVRKQLKREEQLSSERLIAESKVDKTRSRLLTLQRMRESAETSIRSAEAEIERLRSEISGVRANSQEARQRASIALRESFVDLQRAVEQWMQEHVILSPIEGRVSLYMESINEQQFVEEGKEIGVVIPQRERAIEGTIWLRIPQARPVEPGQEVIVRFSSYSSREHGPVFGIVRSKSEFPVNGQVSISVGFPNGLVTEHGTAIKPVQDMKGKATIILEDKRFVQRVLEPLRL